MRLRVANFNWLLLLLINLINHGLTAGQKNHDFRKTLSNPNSLMDTMMTKFSYPKSEVTAGVGYGHYLHPLYYRGQKKMMYPCAVECGEWETMESDDNGYDASSNVDVVTVHPDVSKIDITTTKSLSYKDVSLLRPKKYQSQLFPTATTTLSTPQSMKNNDYTPQDSKGADVQIVPQTSGNKYLAESDAIKDMPNDGSLYAKYYDALVSGYGGELTGDNSEHNDNHHFDPMQESIRYNPPSFGDADNDDIEAPVYPTRIKSHPKRERVEEKYVKHNVREERLEDVRTNSFGSSGADDEDYSTNPSPGKESDDYDHSKYIDDYAAPTNPYYNPNENEQEGSSGARPFRPSPQQGGALQEGGRRPPLNYNGYPRGQNYKPRNKNPQDPNGHADYDAEDYGGDGEADYDQPAPNSGAYFNPYQGNYNMKQGRYNGKRGQDPRLIRRPLIYGRNRKYPQIINGVVNPHRGPIPQSENFRYPPKHGSYPRSLYRENGVGHYHHPYAPRHGYSPQIDESINAGPKSGGIRVVAAPRTRARPPRQGKVPYHGNGAWNNRPYVRGQRISYGRIIPQKDGFTKIVKKYRSFVDHTPKRYVVG